MACAAGPTPELECQYVQANGLRFVRPYVYTYETSVKGRWCMSRGSLLDFLQLEFRGYSREYFEAALASGRLLVNGAPSTPGEGVPRQGMLQHVVHRHEPPVLHAPNLYAVCHDEGGGGVVVVSKPSSWPVHPSGSYFHNSLVNILAHDRGWVGLRIMNRLDRLVSGLVVLARSSEDAARLNRDLADGADGVLKLYVARVTGRMMAAQVPPVTPAEAAPATACDGVEPLHPAVIRFACSIICRDARVGRYEAAAPGTPGGKDSVSEFTPVAYDAATDTTFVIARPITGRTHQLRVHLQAAGFPIANDPHYGGNQAALLATPRIPVIMVPPACAAPIAAALTATGEGQLAGTAGSPASLPRSSSTAAAEAERECPTCQACSSGAVPAIARACRPTSTSETVGSPSTAPSHVVEDGGVQTLRAASIWLHAFRYAHPGRRWDYAVPAPPWAPPEVWRLVVAAGDALVASVQPAVLAAAQEQPALAAAEE
jgi:23S rRNA-/tRNA-specific pseudouridylate synthase